MGLLNAEMLQVVLVQTEECRTWQHVVNAMAMNVEHFKDFQFILTFKMKEVTLHRLLRNGDYMVRLHGDWAGSHNHVEITW